MDPFALQHEARKHVGTLVFLAVCALFMIIAVTTVIATAACWCLYVYFGRHGRHGEILQYVEFLRAFPPVTMISLAVSASMVLGGFFVKLLCMGSGDALMSKVGAVRVYRRNLRESRPDDLAMLRLFNICEEMSIASGVDMPSVWMLPKDMEINAFVAGRSTSSPALCVTAGALRYLERDELQGVIAHEFSHILNGDMELNFRLLALIAGITLVSRTGRLMATWFLPDGKLGHIRWGSRSRRRGGKGGGGVLVILLVYFGTAAALWIAGAAGVFFARLIQCAVSRKREYLADASAAQFTRNPAALANALRLSYLVEMSRGRTAFGVWREDVAHMLFTEGQRSFFSTHPDVRDRIERLAPGTGLKADARLKDRIQRVFRDYDRREEEVNARFREQATRFTSSPAAETDVRKTVLRKLVPLEVRRRLADPAQAGVALLELLRGETPAFWSDEMKSDVRRRLALMCVNTLCDAGTPEDRRKWAAKVLAVSGADGQIDSFEFMVGVAIARRLDPGDVSRVVSPILVRDSVYRVISTVAACGADPERGYQAAGVRLSLFGGSGMPAMPEPYGDLESFAAALRGLARLPPLAKRELMFGLRDTVAQDGTVTDEESDFLMAVADAIGACGWLQTA